MVVPAAWTQRLDCRTTPHVEEEPLRAWSEFWRRWLRIAIIAGAVATLGATFVLIWWLLPPALYRGEAGTDEARLKAITDTRTALLAGLVGIGALGTFWMNSRNVRVAERSQRENFADATERRITELYTNAADQLGSDSAPVRLAGLYALERLAQDNRGQRQTIVNVICAYLQMPFTSPGPVPVAPPNDHENASFSPRQRSSAAFAEAGEYRAERKRYEKHLQKRDKRAQEQRVRNTAIQILSRHRSITVVNRGDDQGTTAYRRWRVTIDLPGAYLAGADLSSVDLGAAIFDEADLTGADLSNANLAWAHLIKADLTGADLRGADLTGISLTKANLTMAILDSTTMATDSPSGPLLVETNLTDAKLRGANLAGANLRGAIMTRADLTEANLSATFLVDADLDGSDLSGAYLSQAEWADHLTTWPKEFDDEIRAASTSTVRKADQISTFVIRKGYRVPTVPPATDPPATA